MPRLSTKIVIRFLPRSMTVDGFQEWINSKGLVNEKDYKLLYYVQGSIFFSDFSRCYIQATSAEATNPIIEKLNKASFPNTTQKVSVTIAPHSEWVENKSKKSYNTLETDPFYIKFLEMEKEKYINEGSEEVENLEFKPISLSDDEEEKKRMEKTRLDFLNSLKTDYRKLVGKKSSSRKRRSKKSGKSANIKKTTSSTKSTENASKDSVTAEIASEVVSVNLESDKSAEKPSKKSRKSKSKTGAPNQNAASSQSPNIQQTANRPVEIKSPSLKIDISKDKSDDKNNSEIAVKEKPKILTMKFIKPSANLIPVNK